MSDEDSSDFIMSSGSDSDYSEKPKKKATTQKGKKPAAPKAAKTTGAKPKKAASNKAEKRPASPSESLNEPAPKVSRSTNDSATSVIDALDKPLEDPASSEAPKKPETPQKIRKLEEQYQKLTQVEHVLKRPDTYIGSVEKQNMDMWVWDAKKDGESSVDGNMSFRSVEFVPGLYKIFDEILVNAADNRQRDANMDAIRVRIDQQAGSIEIWNNGMGIPIEIHRKEKMYIPELIFGHLLTGSNYSDSEKKVVGGRNGFGAKLANIFSTRFELETADGKHLYRQAWKDHMGKVDPPVIKESEDQFTRVKFWPDFKLFKMEFLEDDILALMRKRVFDVAGCNGEIGVRVFLDGKRVPVKSFEDYVKLCIASKSREEEEEEGDGDDVKKEEDDDMDMNDDDDKDSDYEEEKKKKKPKAKKQPNPVTKSSYVIDKNERWQVAVAVSEGEFEQVSFVNSICTIRGGTHVNDVADTITKLLLDTVNKKMKKDGMQIRPFQIKNYLRLFVNSLIENPSFDSQTKETLTTKTTQFGSKFNCSEEFMKKVSKLPIVDRVIEWARAKAVAQASRKEKTTTKSQITRIPKLVDAVNASSRSSKVRSGCTLILTEGDSAKTMVLKGLSVVGNDNYGVFPLRGKLLNVRDASHKALMENKELENVRKIMGLKLSEKEPKIEDLRYGHLMIMTDQDFDGSHIKGLLINFIQCCWPSLVQQNGFLVEFITPIVRVTNKALGKAYEFYTMPQYLEWKAKNPPRGWKIKYYKGLGSSNDADSKRYFSEIEKHQISFSYTGKESDDAIDLAFSKKKVQARKEWMKNFVPGTFLDNDVEDVSYEDFINKELILFSMEDCERSIPSVVDGFKPVQRKIIYYCLNRKSNSETKVCDLGGLVSSSTSYHHGDTSMNDTIIGLAQRFVGSNNINLLYPNGQFGSRQKGGKDHASSRYIHTRLGDMGRYIFHQQDDPILEHLVDDGQKIEPRWYAPVVPMLLVNGCDGIGTGWSTSIPCFNPRDIVRNLRHLLAGEPQEPLRPWYRGWTGDFIYDPKYRSYETRGKWERIPNSREIKITELPLKTWIEPYQDFLIELTQASDKRKEAYVVSQTLVPSDGVHFIVELTENAWNKSDEEITKMLRLTGSISMNNLVAFNANGQLTLYDTPEKIMEEFFDVRMKMYSKRKNNLEQEMDAQLELLDNKTRFILAVVNEEIELRNRAREDLLQQLRDMGFVPKSKLKTTVRKNAAMKASSEDDHADADEEGDKEEKAEDDEDEGESKKSGKKSEDKMPKSEYDYLLTMPLWSLTLERARMLKKEFDDLSEEKRKLHDTSEKQLYEHDLDVFLEKLAEWEVREKAELETGEDGIKIETKSKVKSRDSATTKSSKTVVRKRAPKKPTVSEQKIVKEEKQQGSTAPKAKPTAPASSGDVQIKPEPASKTKPKTEQNSGSSGTGTLDHFFAPVSKSQEPPKQPPVQKEERRIPLFERLKMQASSTSSATSSAVNFFAAAKSPTKVNSTGVSPQKEEDSKATSSVIDVDALEDDDEAKKKPVSRKTKYMLDDDDDDDNDDETEKKSTSRRTKNTSKAPKAATNKRKPASKKKKEDDDDDDLFMMDDEDEGFKKKSKDEDGEAKPSLRTRKRVNYRDYDDDDEENMDDEDDIEDDGGRDDDEDFDPDDDDDDFDPDDDD